MGKLNFQGWKKISVAIPPQNPDGRTGIIQRNFHYTTRMGLKVVGFRIECDPYRELRHLLHLFRRPARGHRPLRGGHARYRRYVRFMVRQSESSTKRAEAPAPPDHDAERALPKEGSFSKRGDQTGSPSFAASPSSRAYPTTRYASSPEPAPRRTGTQVT